MHDKKLSHILSPKNFACLLPGKISNNDLFKLTKQEDIGIVLARTEKMALDWSRASQRNY